MVEPDVPKDFWSSYSEICFANNRCPHPVVRKYLKGTELCIAVEAVPKERWPSLLLALKRDRSLTKIQLCSNTYAGINDYGADDPKKKSCRFAIPFGCRIQNLKNICHVVAEQMSKCPSLQVLRLENFPFNLFDMFPLMEGLEVSHIKHLSLAGSYLQEADVTNLCRALQFTHVEWLDLSSCGLTPDALFSICHLISVHESRQTEVMFPETLRNQQPDWEKLKGLRRLSLNNNYLGNGGVAALMNSLEGDLFIKALDLQMCSIENRGAKRILAAIKTNPIIEMIDLRLNKIDKALQDRIDLELNLNTCNREPMYSPGEIWKPSKILPKVPKSKAFVKTRARRSVSSTDVKIIKINSKSFEKSMRMPRKDRCDKSTNTENSGCYQVSDEMLREYTAMKKTLENELKLRECLLHLLNKYKRQNAFLEGELLKFTQSDDYFLIDCDTYMSLKSTFEKFKKFLDLMRDFGLWECIAMLGINEDIDIDLHPLLLNVTKKCIKIVQNELYGTPQEQLQTFQEVEEINQLLNENKIQDIVRNLKNDPQEVIRNLKARSKPSVSDADAQSDSVQATASANSVSESSTSREQLNKRQPPEGRTKLSQVKYKEIIDRKREYKLQIISDPRRGKGDGSTNGGHAETCHHHPQNQQMQQAAEMTAKKKQGGAALASNGGASASMSNNSKGAQKSEKSNNSVKENPVISRDPRLAKKQQQDSKQATNDGSCRSQTASNDMGVPTIQDVLNIVRLMEELDFGNAEDGYSSDAEEKLWKERLRILCLYMNNIYNVLSLQKAKGTLPKEFTPEIMEKIRRCANLLQSYWNRKYAKEACELGAVLDQPLSRQMIEDLLIMANHVFRNATNVPTTAGKRKADGKVPCCKCATHSNKLVSSHSPGCSQHERVPPIPYAAPPQNDTRVQDDCKQFPPSQTRTTDSIRYSSSNPSHSATSTSSSQTESIPPLRKMKARKTKPTPQSQAPRSASNSLPSKSLSPPESQAPRSASNSLPSKSPSPPDSSASGIWESPKSLASQLLDLSKAHSLKMPEVPPFGQVQDSVASISSQPQNPVKSYLESVSEASTSQDVESISSRVDTHGISLDDFKASISGSFAIQPSDLVSGRSGSGTVSQASSRSAKRRGQRKGSLSKSSLKRHSNASDTSVPSLSDITTVSSRSLNMDSVMRQLSDK